MFLIPHQSHPLIQASAKLHLSDPQQAGAMGRKKHLIRFQAGLSLPAFLERYGQQAPCRQALFAQRWPQGLVCPACGHRRHGHRHGRDVFQRHRGKHPTSLPLARYWPRPNCRCGPGSWPCPWASRLPHSMKGCRSDSADSSGAYPLGASPLARITTWCLARVRAT
ncbi:transposase [Xanthomonas theicola]|uniref:transposase n=1 Tax=Xanthomonas theicola TaxID=56464 RepID=UPI0036235352